MYFQKRANSRAFALIELLVVIAIIGLISAVAFASFNSVRMKARDARRVDDAKTIQNALALYIATNNTFPIAVSSTTLTGADAVSTALIGSGAVPAMPQDPGYPTFTYTYVSDSQGSTYTIFYCQETDSIQNHSIGCNNTLAP